MKKDLLDKPVSRRNFLKVAAAAGGSAALLAMGTSNRAFAQDSKELTMALTWGAEFRPTQDEFDAGFMDRNPNITVDKQYNTWGDHQTQIPTWAAAGILPDIVYTHGTRAAPWAAEGINTNIDDIVMGDAEFNVGDIWDEALTLYKPEGVITALPYDHGPIILGYNKDIFDAAGHAYPDETWTMDDLKAAAVALTDPDNNIFGWAGVGDEAVRQGGHFIPWGAEGWNEDETQLAYDTPEMNEAFNFWVDMIEEGVAPDASQSQAFPTGPWQGGVVAMSPIASWDTPALAQFAGFAWDVAPWPTGPVQKGTGAFGSGFGITNDETRDTAWTYLREYLSEEGMTFMWGASGRGSPARQSAYPSWIAAPIAPAGASFFLDALENYAVTDRPHKSLKGPEVGDILISEVQLMRTGDKSVAEALKTMQERGQAILDG